METLAEALGNQAVEGHPRSHAEEHFVLRLPNYFSSADTRMQYAAIIVSAEKQVAAGSDVQELIFIEAVEQRLEFPDGFVFHQFLATGFDAERVVLQERSVFLSSHSVSSRRLPVAIP